MGLVVRSAAAGARRRSTPRGDETVGRQAKWLPAAPMAVLRVPVGSRPRSAATPGPAAFASQAQPLAAATSARRALEPLALERVETTLYTSLTAALEGNVQRQIDRKLREALASRRVRSTIQSAMYDDIVVERERLGGR